MNQAPSRPMLAGYLCAMAAVIFWSYNFIIARELNDAVAPVSLAFGRWLVAVLVLFPFAIKSLLNEWILVKENLAYLSITAFTGVTLFNTLLYMGGQTTGALNLERNKTPTKFHCQECKKTWVSSSSLSDTSRIVTETLTHPAKIK